MDPFKHRSPFASLDALPPGVRATVRAARRSLREVAPGAQEVPYRSRRPASRSAMWKLARYRLADADVAGIGAFETHASLYFYRGRELAGGGRLLEGGGKDLRFVRLASPADASSAQVKRLLREAFRLGAARRRPAVREAARSARKRTRGAATIDAYLDSVAEKQRRALEALRRTIRVILPEAEECISYGMPAFRLRGRVVGGFAATASGCSYYPFSGRTLDTLASDLAGYSRTKSALHFGTERALPEALVRKLLRARIAEARGRPRSP